MALSEHEIPTVYFNKDTATGVVDTPVSMVYEEVSVGDSVVDVEYYSKVATNIGSDVIIKMLIDSVDNYSVDTVVESLIYSVASYTNNSIVDIVTSITQDNLIDTASDLFLQAVLVNGSDDSKTHYRINLGTINVYRDIVVDLTLASAKYFNTIADIYCAASGTLYIIDGDIRQQTGNLWGILGDIYSVVENKPYTLNDIFTTTSSTLYIPADIQKATGRRAYYLSDVFSCTAGERPIGVDFKTRSLFVAGFFLAADNFTAASGIGYVDMVDYLYEIDEATISIFKDDTTISGIIIQDIPNGKRVFFNPIDDFYSLGEVVITVYAESVYGEVLDEDFYLLYGYNLELDEVGLFWDADTRIYVTATASNLATCKNTEGIHYYFDTSELPSINLGAYINAVAYQDLACSIYPRSTAFYYGQTYTVRISGVKDFHGNLMPDFEYSFTIEDR